MTLKVIKYLLPGSFQKMFASPWSRRLHPQGDS